MTERVSDERLADLLRWNQQVGMKTTPLPDEMKNLLADLRDCRAERESWRVLAERVNERADRLIAERDRLRALLVRARDYIDTRIGMVSDTRHTLLADIDAALKTEAGGPSALPRPVLSADETGPAPDLQREEGR